MVVFEKEFEGLWLSNDLILGPRASIKISYFSSLSIIEIIFGKPVIVGSYSYFMCKCSSTVISFLKLLSFELA